MNPATGNVVTPDKSPTCDVIEAYELLALEETFPYLRHVALDHWLVLGVVGACRIRDELAEGRILQERTVEPGHIRISQIQTCLEVVDHDPLRAALEEAEGFLKTTDHRFEVLPENGNDTGEPAVAHNHDEGIDQAGERC